MVTLRTSSVDIEDLHGARPHKHPRAGEALSGMPPGMPPLGAINGGHRAGTRVVGPSPMGVGPPLPPHPPGVGGGPPSRTTAMSRRGGRTRARSPIVVSSPVPGGRRPGSVEPPTVRPPSVTGDQRRGAPPTPGKNENPSSAAAAAAAAAKAYSENNIGVPAGGHGRSTQWPERHHDDRGGYPHSPYSRAGGGPNKKWPAGGGDPIKMPGGPPPGHYSHHSPYGLYGGGYDSYDPYAPHHGGDRRYRERGPPPLHPSAYAKAPDGREGSHRGGGGPDVGRGPVYRHHHHHHHSDYDHRAYMGRGGGRDVRGPLPPQHQPPPSPAHGHSSQTSGRTSVGPPREGGSGGGTSLVIGGTTPIHVPKSDIHPEPAERPSRALAASVFRGRGNSESVAPSAPVGADDHSDDADSQHKAPPLFSLKTPSTSFEEKKTDETKRPGSAGPPQSPKDLPRLHGTSLQQRQVDMFDRSPDGNKETPPIDINPSFPLFNQSFDSLGEHYGLHVESTLHADSFGMMPSSSNVGDSEVIASVLKSAFSTGNGSTQLLAPSGSGHLTFGYSPVNSFGEAPAPPRRQGGTTMLLGGSEEPPTEVLSSYHQGHDSGHRDGGPLAESHFRMSTGSFGAYSYGRPAGYGEPGSTQHYYHGPAAALPPETKGDGSPPFYLFLKKYKNAFAECAFLLPGLKVALSDKQSSDKNGDQKPPTGYSSSGEPSAHDIVIARRRVESSVCAFGGSHGIENQSTKSPNKSTSGSNSPTSSIFRGREKTSTAEETPATTVTPSSSTASPTRPGSAAKQKARYEEELPGRYYENDNRLSWEFEENPPVEISTGLCTKRVGQDKNKEISKSTDESNTVSKRLGATSPPASKMRYRCKLCGQPKQNHTCPYQQSLARSIGIMVYPAVNAFTAAEPGSFAPPLTEMNNFTDISEKGSVANESSPGRSGVPLTSPKQVTPESARASPRQLQINSPPTTPGKTPTRKNTGIVRRSGPSRGRKRPHGYEGRMTDEQGDLLFVDAMELKPQQFLTVSENSDLNRPDAYAYLALPLPYAQRKRLSDNLFSLSNEVPKLTDECAQVLREAREKDKWDLAVAELMTQVIVVLHCRDGDHRFEGLRQYLLTLGIAC